MSKEGNKKKQANAVKGGFAVRILNEAFLQIVLYVLLLLWALLPAGACAGFVFYSLAEPKSFPYVYQAYLYMRSPLNFYGRLFFILGTVTLFIDILYLCALPRKVSARMARAQPWHFLLLFILLWSVISLLVSDSPLPQFLGSEYQYDGLFSYFLFAGVYLCAVLYSSETGRLRILRVFTALANLCTLIMLGQAFQISPFTEIFLSDRTSVFFNRNHFAYYLCTSIICLAGLYLYDRGVKRKIWYIASFCFQLYGLLVNDTFGSYLAVLFALPVILVFCLKSGRKWAPSLAVPAVLFLLISLLAYTKALPGADGWNATIWRMRWTLSGDLEGTQETAGEVNEAKAAEAAALESALESGHFTSPLDSLGTGRIHLWINAGKLIAQHPLFGVGPDGMPENYDPDNNRPHNTFLQIGVFLGIPAMLAYLAALILLAWKQWKRLKDLRPSTLIAAGGAVTYLISSFFGVPMFYTTPYLFLCLGMTTALPEEYQEAASENPADWLHTFEERLIFWTSGVLILCLMVFMMLSRYAERARETADTTNMNLAAMQASSAKAENVTGEFWYEPEEGGLLPVEGNAVSIAPYGQGTALRGAYYIERHLNGLPYDEAEDYRGKILRVTLDPARYGDTIMMDWVSLEIPAN